MRVAVVGGGPGGLSFAAFLRARRPDWPVTVWEREWPPPSGFGLVLPGRTLARLAAADPDLVAALRPLCVRWSRIDVHYRGSVVSCDGHDYRAVGRLALLGALRARCRALGVDLRAGRVTAPPPGCDLVVAADGARSALRGAGFAPRLRRGGCVYAWLAVDRRFDAFAFHLAECDEGVVTLHAYPYGDGVSTVIVETPADVWRRFHPGRAEPGPAPVPLPGSLRRLLAAELGPVRLHHVAPRWQRFLSVEVGSWSAGNTVLVGDAAHACHFSVGSGTRLAMEDALALAECLAGGRDRAGALARYEQVRRPVVDATRAAAEASRRWFEDAAAHLCPDPLRFAERLLTRSGRPPAGPLRLLRPADRPPGPAAAPPPRAGEVVPAGEAVGDLPHLP